MAHRALNVAGINVPVNQIALVTFTISSAAPASGFYLQQTNSVTGNSVYLTESVAMAQAPPEPSTIALGMTALLLLRFGRRA